MLLGDGCLKPKPHVLKDGKKTNYYEFVVCHSTKQKEYFEYKLDLFHSIMGGKKPKISFYKGKLGESLRFSRCHKMFRFFHKKLYSNNGKKVFIREVLNTLTPEAIALWYMDDGGIIRNYNTQGGVSSFTMRLFTYCSFEEALTISNYFHEVYDILPKILKYGKKDQYNVVFNTKQGLKLASLLSPYVVGSMQYKLPSYDTRVLDTLTSKVEGEDIV